MKKIIYMALVVMAAASCNMEKLLTLSPESQLTPDAYFKTAEDLQLFSNTFYNNLLDKTPYDKESDLFVKMNPSNLIRGGNDRTVPASGGGWSFTNLRKMNTLHRFFRGGGSCIFHIISPCMLHASGEASLSMCSEGTFRTGFPGRRPVSQKKRPLHI